MALKCTEIHGHRGCGGRFPPNTIPAFVHAAELGCHWLEMDVVITGDGHVLVSHEPWMDHRSCMHADGRGITEAEGLAFNVYMNSLASAQAFRVKAEEGGALAEKPTLAEVAHAVQAVAQGNGKDTPRFNIEIKSDPAWYGTFQPAPAEMGAVVHAEIKRLKLEDRCIVQCFDPAILLALHRMAPELPLAFLAEKNYPVASVIGKLGFTPGYYSPSHELINEQLVQTLRSYGMGILAWTVNTEAEMRRLVQLGIDGLITDEPAKALALLADDR